MCISKKVQREKMANKQDVDGVIRKMQTRLNELKELKQKLSEFKRKCAIVQSNSVVFDAIKY